MRTLAAFVFLTSIFIAMGITHAFGNEYQVALNGSDDNPGTPPAPLRTIQHAADIAQPGDVITVHAGIYRERVSPPRGGESDAKRITYQAAPGEKVTIIGSDPAKGWQTVSGDVWKLVIPNKYFGAFNPYSDLIHGDWYISNRPNHTGAVYLNGVWLSEAASLAEVTTLPTAGVPRWFATVDGADSGAYQVEVESLKPAGGAAVSAARASAVKEAASTDCSEGGKCMAKIHAGSWLMYNGVDFGQESKTVDLRVASLDQKSRIELHLDNAGGQLLGAVETAPTGDWKKWTTIQVATNPISGKHDVCMVFKLAHVDTDNTTIWAQFKGVDPNQSDVEINVRKTVFSPEKTGINYITVRGFTMRDGATNWAPPSAGQIGLVSAYWCKGWIIENNDIAYSRCCGIALGKYSDEFDNTNKAGSANPYTECVRRALAHGWNKETVGGHIVRNNRISFCGQTGIVGSMGCAFSTITGNEVHDIHIGQYFRGWEMAGIKFHGATVLSGCFANWEMFFTDAQ